MLNNQRIKERMVPWIHLHVMSIEEENDWGYESNVEILDVNLNLLRIDVYECYSRKLRHLASRFTKLYKYLLKEKKKKKAKIEFIRVVIFSEGIQIDIERDRESAYDIVEVETDGVGSAAEAEDEDLVDGVSDDCVHLSLFRQRR